MEQITHAMEERDLRIKQLEEEVAELKSKLAISQNETGKLDVTSIIEERNDFLRKQIETKVLPYLQSLLDKVSIRSHVKIWFYLTDYSYEWVLDSSSGKTVIHNWSPCFTQYPELMEFDRIISHLMYYSDFSFPDMSSHIY